MSENARRLKTKIGSVAPAASRAMTLNDPGQGMQYMQLFFLNATVSLSVIALLAAGATLPIFVFNHQAFSLTRRRKHTDK